MIEEVFSATDHERRVVVRRRTDGWEVSEEIENRVIRRVNYRDWHRVERALQMFQFGRDLVQSTNL